MIEKPFAEYAERNGGPILDVLRVEFRRCKLVLEIGSGTGQHAARFAAALPHLSWQTSDLDENLDGIRAWVDDAALDNLLAPLSIDVRSKQSLNACYDGVFSANTTHIMSFDTVKRMLALVGTVLNGGGLFCLYGPFRQGGEFNTPSNEQFDRTLRARDPAMGIRDLGDLDDLAKAQDMARIRIYAMPANNHLAIWEKT